MYLSVSVVHGKTLHLEMLQTSIKKSKVIKRPNKLGFQSLDSSANKK